MTMSGLNGGDLAWVVVLTVLMASSATDSLKMIPAKKREISLSILAEAGLTSLPIVLFNFSTSAYK